MIVSLLRMLPCVALYGLLLTIGVVAAQVAVETATGLLEAF